MIEPDNVALDARRKRILFRATHRGTYETDLLVGGFLAPRLAEMSDSDLAQAEAILDLPDVDLADWLTGRRPIPDGIGLNLLHAMRDAAPDSAGHP